MRIKDIVVGGVYCANLPIDDGIMWGWGCPEEDEESYRDLCKRWPRVYDANGELFSVIKLYSSHVVGYFTSLPHATLEMHADYLKVIDSGNTISLSELNKEFQ